MLMAQKVPSLQGGWPMLAFEGQPSRSQHVIICLLHNYQACECGSWATPACECILVLIRRVLKCFYPATASRHTQIK